MEKASFIAPTTPGWELLRSAAEAVMVDEPTPENVTTFLAHLIARKDELIPPEFLAELTPLLVTASCAISDIRIDNFALLFLDAQIGREELTKQLAVTGQWIIEDCDCGHAPGYHAWTADEEKLRRRKAEMIMQYIFGGHGISVVQVVGFGNGKRQPDEGASVADAASSGERVEETVH